MKLKFILLVLIIGLKVSAQYQIPLYTPGNTGGQSFDNEHSILSVYGQNLIGISTDDNNKVYFGILAPLTITNTGYKLLPELNSKLLQNYPNPYNSTTTIPFEITKELHVKLSVINMYGQLIDVLLDQEMPEGRHNIKYNAIGLSSGIYIYRLEIKDHLLTKTMALMQ